MVEAILFDLLGDAEPAYTLERHEEDAVVEQRPHRHGDAPQDLDAELVAGAAVKDAPVRGSAVGGKDAACRSVSTTI